MGRNTGLGCLVAPILAVGVCAAAAAVDQETSVDFEKVTDKAVFDGAGRQCALLTGAAEVSADAKHGQAALHLGGPRPKAWSISDHPSA